MCESEMCLCICECAFVCERAVGLYDAYATLSNRFATKTISIGFSVCYSCDIFNGVVNYNKRGISQPFSIHCSMCIVCVCVVHLILYYFYMLYALFCSLSCSVCMALS